MTDRHPIVAATVAALRGAASWLGDDEDMRMLRDAAEAICAEADSGQLFDGTDGCCPFCEEVTCDDGCPLQPLRNPTGDTT